MHDLMTIGYEGLSLDQFFRLLRHGEVQTLVDVRELPLSRKPGFSKSALSAAVTSHGLSYVHAAPLGCPRDVRHAYRADGDWARYTQRFAEHMDTQQEAVMELAERVQSERCCLLCFEADPNFCHRSFVADRVALAVGPTLIVTHLMSTSPAPTAPHLQMV